MMNTFVCLLSISLLAGGGDKVGVTGVIQNEQDRNFGMGHTGTNADYIQQLRNTVLPVSLLNFDVKARANSVKVEWRTGSEKNSSHFILKRSGDDGKFTELARLRAQGESSTISFYQYIDQLPLLGSNYYQLEQIDLNGTKTLSELIVANYQMDEQKVYTYFSADGVLNIVIKASKQDGLVNIVVYDTNGRVVSTKNLDTDQANHYQFNDVTFEKGIYIVSTNLKDQLVNQKVIK